MAIVSGGERHCRLTHIENGNVINRRIQTMVVQSPKGAIHSLSADQLPDAITLTCGIPKKGNSLEVLLGSPPRWSLFVFIAEFCNGTRARDLAFMFVGMFVMTGLTAVADALARMLGD